MKVQRSIGPNCLWGGRNPLNRNAKLRYYHRRRYDLTSMETLRSSWVFDYSANCMWVAITCDYLQEYETPRRNWVYFFNCGNVSVGQSYQITIAILWWPVSNDTGYGNKRLNRENPHPSCSRSRRINDYPKLKLYQEFQWVEYSPSKRGWYLDDTSLI